ncbi:MAG: cytochrome c3 family protein [Nitrospirota bacterium]|nr:cytochrome c3 family protein [Nitrospirota bacterium]
MRRHVLSLLLLAACAVAAWSALRNEVHDFPEDRCGDCHAASPVKGDPQARVMKAPLSELCSRCHHRPDNTVSHPVDFTPLSGVFPADLPLSWDGKLTCSTCHDIHATSAQAGEGPVPSLRRSGGRAFCEACHSRGAGAPDAPSGHAQVLTTAHMEYDAMQTGRIDAVSSACLSCHDGSIGAPATVRIGSFRHGIRTGDTAQELSHPVGVSYRRAMLRRGGLRPPETLDRRIRLVNGKVSCASCHNMFSREARLLTVANNRSGLCLECHDK